jgi:hypothetical protein
METLKEASRSADGNMLFMFYGLLNINKLAEIFKGCFKADSIEAVAADLRSRAVALELDGWGRTFGSKYATIEPIYGVKLRTYGIYLSKQEGYICD